MVFHVIFIVSVFDCYFTSPVVFGMNHHDSGHGEAMRLVLIVGNWPPSTPQLSGLMHPVDDGLLVDLLFTSSGFAFGISSRSVVAPPLRSIAKKGGAFNVSHTRVPTESCPGHVANIVSSAYTHPLHRDSDVSQAEYSIGAVDKTQSKLCFFKAGRPTQFRLGVNQSRRTFSFGFPDILSMFAKGASPDKALTWCYDEEAEDFTKDATTLDTWVLDRLRCLFENANGCYVKLSNTRLFPQEYMRSILDNAVDEVEHLVFHNSTGTKKRVLFLPLTTDREPWRQW
ncbi:hypothetical protein F5141DRAFT_1212309 [Pisolithus sp. B1]|nr:hypothetical protein F5141DRAFT_1212309 [Pisolithus sp. B1]